MAEQSDLHKKWEEMKDHVTKPRKELDGMAVCPFAKMGFKRNEVEVKWVKKDMFKIANEAIENYPEEKQLVLNIPNARGEEGLNGSNTLELVENYYL